MSFVADRQLAGSAVSGPTSTVSAAVGGGALDPMSAGQGSSGVDSKLSVLVVRGLLQGVEHAGVSRDDFVRAAGIDVAIIDSLEARIARSEVDRLCELALDLTGDAAFGLHWAENLNERMFVPISHLLVQCASLRQAFEMLAQFFRLFSDTADYQVTEQGDSVTLSCRALWGGSERTRRFTAEMMMSGFWQLIRSFDRTARPLRVGFEHAAPSYQHVYSRLFAGAQCFSQPATELVFARALMDKKATSSDEGVRDALAGLAQQRLQRITHGTSYAQRVREHLLRDGWPHSTDMERVAHALQTSERSLRRRLSDEGTSYNEVLSEALATIAKTFLRGKRHTIQEVAFEMGFSDASTFHRAFKRWTGMTPSEYREAALRGPIA